MIYIPSQVGLSRDMSCIGWYWVDWRNLVVPKWNGDICFMKLSSRLSPYQPNEQKQELKEKYLTCFLLFYFGKIGFYQLWDLLKCQPECYSVTIVDNYNLWTNVMLSWSLIMDCRNWVTSWHPTESFLASSVKVKEIRTFKLL